MISASGNICHKEKHNLQSLRVEPSAYSWHSSMNDSNSSRNSEAMETEATRSPVDVNEIDQNDRNGQLQHNAESVQECEETNDVRRGRIIVFTLLILSAMSSGFFDWSLRRAEYNNFQSIFHDDSSKLSEALFTGVMNTFASMDLLSTVMVTHARAANEQWPFTTLPYFGNIAAKMLSMSTAITVASMMLVDGADQRKQWEEYAWKHGRKYVNETLHLMATDANYRGEIPWDVPLVYSIHSANNTVSYNES
jgi:hypothetical protein